MGESRIFDRVYEAPEICTQFCRNKISRLASDVAKHSRSGENSLPTIIRRSLFLASFAISVVLGGPLSLAYAEELTNAAAKRIMAPPGIVDLPPASPIYRPGSQAWQGFYIGVDSGLGFNKSQVIKRDDKPDITDLLPGQNTPGDSYRAVEASLFAGARKNFDGLVVGIEAALSIQPDRYFGTADNGTNKEKLLEIAIRPQVGFLLSQNVHVFGRLGVIASDEISSLSFDGASYGISAGGGVEIAMSRRFLMRFALDYSALASKGDIFDVANLGDVPYERRWLFSAGIIYNAW